MAGNFKPYTWDNPNKMHFDSGFKLFDKQTNYIGYGNVCANTQTSMYIRPFSEVKNGSYIGKPGDFLRFDMQLFGNVPSKEIRERIYDKERKESVILYKFFVTRRDKTTGRCYQDVIGYVLTDYNHKFLSRCYCYPFGQSAAKRVAALDECMNYICDGWWR